MLKCTVLIIIIIIIIISERTPVFCENAFDSIISEKVPPNKDRLYFLNKYTNGKANEVVKGFLAVNTKHAYTEAQKPSSQRFGNPIYMAEVYKSGV